jgi:hypothetical protein
MKLSREDIIKKYCNGRINTDILAGWEAASRGEPDHRAPEHLEGARHLDWLCGWKGYKTRKADYTTFVTATKRDGREYKKEYKGMPNRGRIVTQAEKEGCTGDVHVYVYDMATMTGKSYICGI